MESKNWDDIGYNFLVGGDGEVYEGRGWDKQGAHTKGESAVLKIHTSENFFVNVVIIFRVQHR